MSAAPLRCFDLRVRALTPLSPHLVRVTFGGPDLARLEDGGALGPRDLRVKLLFPPPGRDVPPLGELTDGWYRRWLAVPEAERGWMRTYTLRRARPADADPQVDVDFVVHPPGVDGGDGGDRDVGLDGAAGPAARWLAGAAVGDRLRMLGPDADHGYGPDLPGVEWRPPPGTRRVLLVGDETAVPAVGSVLATLDRGLTGHALLEVPADADRLAELAAAAPAGVRVLWCVRGRRPRGVGLGSALRAVLDADPPARTDGARPADAAQALPAVDVDRELLWEAGTSSASGWYGWLAGEAAVVRDLRRHLVAERGVDRRSVAFMGYWREGRAERS